MTQVLFDIAQANPPLSLSDLFPPAGCLVLAAAWFKPAWVDAATTAYWRGVSPLVHRAGNNPIVVLVLSLVPTLLATLQTIPKLLIPAAIAFGLWSGAEIHSYLDSRQQIAALRTAPIDRVITGPITRLDKYLETFMFIRSVRRHEILQINGQTFDYTDDEPGSPYPLTAFWPELRVGSTVSISVAQGKIVLVGLLR